MAERASAVGAEIVELPADQVRLLGTGDPQRDYAAAKATLAVTVAPPSKLRFQPIAPSADWRIDLAEGCPAHCAYCYLAGSLTGPPITRAYANLPEILGAVPSHIGRGAVTSRSRARREEGTTFEASCYTDPLGIEHLTGSLAAAIAWFGATAADVQLRFTTKFDAVGPLLDLPHGGRTRMRASINPAAFARFEGGTSPAASRIDALARMAQAGYPIGLTVAPIIAAEGWREAYDGLFALAAARLGPAVRDLTVELITHRFTPGSKQVLESWYPGSRLEMDPAARQEKRGKFGGTKHVYPAALMRDLRDTIEAQIAHHLPDARILYWT